jgi:hypothetical protein
MMRQVQRQKQAQAAAKLGQEAAKQQQQLLAPVANPVQA